MRALLEQSMIYQCDGAASICSSAESEEEVGDYENEGESEEEVEDSENEGGNNFEASDIESLAEYEAEQTDNDDLDEQSQGVLSDEYDEHNIPVHINQNRRPRIIEERTRELRFVQTISQKTEASLSPTIAVTNFRSLSAKLNNVKIDILERSIDILIGSETWQKESNKTLKGNIEKLLEENGLQCISCPRPSSKRGGGCAVIVNLKNFTVEKLPIPVPHKLEVVWCLVRPKAVIQTTTFKEILVASFYSPPNYRKNSILLQHLIEQIQLLLIKYPKAGYLCAGDRNENDTQPLGDALPKCKQIVTKYTYKKGRFMMLC